MSKPILHGAPLSPFVRKARVALAEKGVDYELDPLVPFGVADEYKKLSPLKKIPCWDFPEFSTCCSATSAIIDPADTKLVAAIVTLRSLPLPSI